MALIVTPFSPSFGVEFTGLDLTSPIDDAAIATIVAAMDRYAVGVFRNRRPLSDDEHVAFSRRFGPIQRTPVLLHSGVRPRITVPEIIDQSNLDADGRILPEDGKQLLYKRANRQWHTDMSFHPVRATYSLLSAHVIPPAGADTEFCDLRAAYDSLPRALQARLEPLEADHSYWHSRVTAGGPEPDEAERRSRPPARHRIVQTHRGRKTLYLASHAYSIAGMAQAEARALLAELAAFATAERFIYRHQWQIGDLLIWDNLCTMHRATPFDDQRYPRDLRRTTVREAEVD